ncbi:MAG TPA: hypothetical protein ENH82_04185 [bacterium]|nr:hypothetical protein [bacterium]
MDTSKEQKDTPKVNGKVVDVDMLVRLRIRKHNDENIVLEALEGIDHFGFGTFLCNIKPNEIDCDEFSKQVMLLAKEQIGLNGLEIWNDNRIAWGDPSHKIIMPISEISRDSGCAWLNEIAV